MPAAPGRVPTSAAALLRCARGGQPGCAQPGSRSGSLQGAASQPERVAHYLKADGTGGGEDQAEAQSGHGEGQPAGAPGQAGPGWGGECYGREKEKLAEGRREEDDDAEGGRLAGSIYGPGVGPEGKVLVPLEKSEHEREIFVAPDIFS